jgi:NAD(P)-dependent dehydrogenase (short-subunit alcohol dehydrogenase family)
MGCSLARCAPLTIDAGEPETPESVWDEVLRVNLTGVFFAAGRRSRRCSKVAAEASSICHRSAPARHDLFGAIRRGEGRRDSADALCRGAIRISRHPRELHRPGACRYADVAGNDRSVEELARRAAEIPLGRAGKPGEIASLALYLASSEAAFVNGAAIVIDGGATTR